MNEIYLDFNQIYTDRSKIEYEVGLGIVDRNQSQIYKLLPTTNNSSTIICSDALSSLDIGLKWNKWG